MPSLLCTLMIYCCIIIVLGQSCREFNNARDIHTTRLQAPKYCAHRSRLCACSSAQEAASPLLPKSTTRRAHSSSMRPLRLFSSASWLLKSIFSAFSSEDSLTASAAFCCAKKAAPCPFSRRISSFNRSASVSAAWTLVACVDCKRSQRWRCALIIHHRR